MKKGKRDELLDAQVEQLDTASIDLHALHKRITTLEEHVRSVAQRLRISLEPRMRVRLRSQGPTTIRCAGLLARPEWREADVTRAQLERLERLQSDGQIELELVETQN